MLWGWKWIKSSASWPWEKRRDKGSRSLKNTHIFSLLSLTSFSFVFFLFPIILDSMDEFTLPCLQPTWMDRWKMCPWPHSWWCRPHIAPVWPWRQGLQGTSGCCSCPETDTMSTSGKMCKYTLNHILLNQWWGIFSFTVRQKKGKSPRKKFSNIEVTIISLLVWNLPAGKLLFAFSYWKTYPWLFQTYWKTRIIPWCIPDDFTIQFLGAKAAKFLEKRSPSSNTESRGFSSWCIKGRTSG